MSDYDKEVHKLLYHLGEVSKIHAKLIEGNKDKSETNDSRLHKLEKDIAIMAERMKSGFQVNDPHIDQMVVNKPRETKDIVTIVAVGLGVLMASLMGGAKLFYEFIINKP